MYGCGFTLAGLKPGLWRLDAVIHAVADQVHQGIVQLVDDGLVQLGVGAIDGEFYVRLRPTAWLTGPGCPEVG
jgi:hypothetical protein